MPAIWVIVVLEFAVTVDSERLLQFFNNRTGHQLRETWRQAACRKDLRIVGRLAVPRSLNRYLRAHLGGLRAVRKEVGHYQNKVLDSVTAVLEHAVPKRPPNKPNPFSSADWTGPLPL